LWWKLCFHVRIKILPLWHLCVPTLLTGVEVSSPKTINLKQYLNTNNFSSNLHKQHNSILQKYFITTPLHLSAKWGHIDVTKILVEAGASPSAVDNDVIKPSVNLRKSNIKLLKFHMRNIINNKFKTIFKHKQFLIKSSQTTQLYTTKVFYYKFSCHHHITNNFL
jgi:hypothetical protein